MESEKNNCVFMMPSKKVNYGVNYKDQFLLINTGD